MLVATLRFGSEFCDAERVSTWFGPVPDFAVRHAREPMAQDRESQADWIFATATVLLAVAVGLFVHVLIALAGQAIGGRAALRWLDSTPVGLTLVAALSQFALLLLVRLRAARVPKLFKELRASFRYRKCYVLPAVVLIVALGPFANFVGLFVAKTTHSSLDSSEFIGALIRRASPAEFVALGLVLTVLPAIVEESLFRGLVFHALRELGVPVALVLQAFAFGVFHLDIAQGIATSILGLGFGFIVYSTGSLAGSMLAHGCYNLMVLMSQRWLPQSEDSFSGQLVELAVGMLVASASAVYLYRRRQRES
jgi:membrane protease YdiL (CAAX protease family)